MVHLQPASAWQKPGHGPSLCSCPGRTDMYRQGEFMVWTDGNIYECIDPNGTAYSPGDYAAAWQKWEG